MRLKRYFGGFLAIFIMLISLSACSDEWLINGKIGDGVINNCITLNNKSEVCKIPSSN